MEYRGDQESMGKQAPTAGAHFFCPEVREEKWYLELIKRSSCMFHRPTSLIAKVYFQGL